MALVDETVSNTTGPATNLPTMLPISKIRTDGGTQPRDQVSPTTVDEYAEAMRNGAMFPAVTVFNDGSTYWLADGYHRLVAAEQIGANEIACDIKQGTRRDAVLFSVGANATHGLPRTQADKRRAIETLLRDEEWIKWSDREIARRTNTTHPSVARVRQELGLTGKFTSENGTEAESRTYTTKHGTTATMQTSNIGSSSKPATLAPDQDSYPTEKAALVPATTPQSPMAAAPAVPASNATPAPVISRVETLTVPVVEDDELVGAEQPEAEEETGETGPVLTPVSDDPIQNGFGCSACKHHVTSFANLASYHCAFLNVSEPLEQRRVIGAACTYWKCEKPQAWETKLNQDAPEAALAVTETEVREFIRAAATSLSDKALAALANNPYLFARWSEIKSQSLRLVEEAI